MKKYDKNHTRQIIMPVGGIGTGSIGIDGTGRLKEWEIFGRPNLGSINGHSHFAVRAIRNSKIVSVKALCGEYLGNFTGPGNGADGRLMAGFPHFEDWEFTNCFPFGTVSFSDKKFPGKVSLEAFNPFIPFETDDSSIPAAFYRVTFDNDSGEDLEYTAALSVKNPFSKTRNVYSEKNGLRCITLSNDVQKDDVSFGDVTIASYGATSFQEYWYRGGWQDPIVTFWREFSECREFSNRRYGDCGTNDTATLLCNLNVKAGEKGSVCFVISWNVPKVVKYWDGFNTLPPDAEKTVWNNYYTKRFSSSLESAAYSCENFDVLEKKTRAFANALHSSTYPPEVIDAAASNLSVLKSTTCLRLEDGSFYGWEGVWGTDGSCEGTCQHVWNYAYALCYLFPDLERSIRELEFRYCLRDTGKTSFRLVIPPESSKQWDFRACVDGQMGTIVKTYREWKLSGKDEWMKSHYLDLKKMLDYAASPDNPDRWDADCDGVMEGRQHHTLDMELFGPSSWLEGFYLIALKAFAEIASYFGYKDDAEKYMKMFEHGSEWTEKNLFNGRYYIQKIDLKDRKITDSFGASEDYFNEEKGEIKYQIGEGCEIDQILAQWHSDILGLGDIFDADNRKTALKSLFRNNFKESMADFANPWRVFSLNKESGAVICDYPEGVYKPVIPVPYCEETMHGFEYALAGLMIAEGMKDEGLRIVRSVRDRYDGDNRNPFNEIECGNHYARSMASFALMPLMAGFDCDMRNKSLAFSPIDGGRFKTFFTAGTSWGIFERLSDSCVKISVSFGKLSLSSLRLPFLAGRKCTVTSSGTSVSVRADENGVLALGGVDFTEMTICAE